MILEDGIVTEQERQDLMLAVNQTAGNVVDEETVGYEFSKQVWEDIVDCLEVAGSAFARPAILLAVTGMRKIR